MACRDRCSYLHVLPRLALDWIERTDMANAAQFHGPGEISLFSSCGTEEALNDDDTGNQ